MTDLEMTTLCAEAIGLHVGRIIVDSVFVCDSDEDIPTIQYDPLHDDAQAMALVKKFALCVWQATWNPDQPWYVEAFRASPEYRFAGNVDLNRAIVECVSRMQAEK